MDFFYMPTKVIFEDQVINKQEKLFKALGNRCLIVTGKYSAKKSGALDDLTSTLESLNVDYELFDEIMENPTIEVVQLAADTYKSKNIDFIVGIGGGSPLDASKMIGVLLKNKEYCARDLIEIDCLTSFPIVAIPTTSGTGSETTPYSILTDHEKKTKLTCKPKIFPTYALLDTRYFMTMPEAVIRSTSVDALCHLSEGFLVKNSNIYSDELAKSGLMFFKKTMDDLKAGNFTKEMHENLIHASTIAGMVISHTGTGIPHGMGYQLTYHHGVYHGKATALFLASMVELHIRKDHLLQHKGQLYLELLGFQTSQQLREFIFEVVGTFEITQEECDDYAYKESLNKRKLECHTYEITHLDIKKAFEESLIIK